MEDCFESDYKCAHCSDWFVVKFTDGGPAYKIMRCPLCSKWLIVTCVGVNKVRIAQ